MPGLQGGDAPRYRRRQQITALPVDFLQPHLELGDIGLELRDTLGRGDRQLLQRVLLLREPSFFVRALLGERALALLLGKIGVLAPPHLYLRQIALVGKLDSARQLTMGDFDALGLDRLLPRERSDLISGTLNLRF